MKMLMLSYFGNVARDICGKVRLIALKMGHGVVVNERNGKCLSIAYINNQITLEWECSKGHRWMNNANSVKSDTCFRQCNIKKNAERQRKSIEYMRILAANKNGECLSEEYIYAHEFEWAHLGSETK